MKLPTRIAFCFAFCAFGSIGFAQLTFTDDFDRAELGPDWSMTGGTNWTIQDGTLRGGGGGGSTANHFLYYNGLALDNSWTAEINFEFLSVDQSWDGFVYQLREDSGTYEGYLDRFRTKEAFASPTNAAHQWMQAERTATTLGFPGGHEEPPAPAFGINTAYSMTVSSDFASPGEYEVSLWEGETLLQEVTLTTRAAWADLHGLGHIGFFDLRSTAIHDISLTVIPEPGTTAAATAGLALLFALWVRRRRTGRGIAH